MQLSEDRHLQRKNDHVAEIDGMIRPEFHDKGFDLCSDFGMILADYGGDLVRSGDQQPAIFADEIRQIECGKRFHVLSVPRVSMPNGPAAGWRHYPAWFGAEKELSESRFLQEGS